MFKQSYRIPGSRERVFEALVDPAHLCRWFAEHVAIEPHVGGAYRFWGRHTLWTLEAEAADQVITSLESPAALAFRWTWNGSPTEVALELVQADGGVELSLCHTFDAGFGYERCDDLVSSFWGLAIDNLRRYLRRGEPALLPDLYAPEREIRLSIQIDAPPSRVFRALTDPEQMNRWLSDAATVVPEVGGAYSYGWPEGPSRIVEWAPDRLLVHDWSTAGEAETTVRWELEPADGGTRVTLTHSPFQQPKATLAHRIGWSAFLTELDRVAPDLD